MASAFGHAAVALAGTAFIPKKLCTKKVVILGIVCTIFPDIDVLSFKYGIAYEHWLGHRGVTHGLLFGIIWAALITAIFHFKAKSKGPFLIYYFICSISHGLLDAMTSGGRGVGFFIPFSTERFFLPFRPIQVSPIGMKDFFSEWGLAVLGSELLWIMVPCLILYTLVKSIKNYGT